MPQTSGHTQVSQSQSSSSAHVPGQSQTLSFTNPRRSQSFFDMFCPNTNCCPKKYVLHSLSLYPIQEPIGKEQLPGGGHWKRGSCARACTSVHLMKPPVRRAAILGLPESCPGAKKQRVPKKIDWTFPGFVFGIVDRSCISHDFQASKCQSCMILSGDSVKTQRPEASKTSVKSA